MLLIDETRRRLACRAFGINGTLLRVEQGVLRLRETDARRIFGLAA